MRSGWGNCGCLTWRRGGWGETFSLSTTTWKEVVVRQVSVPSPKWQVIGREAMASSCIRAGSDWTSENFCKGYQALEQAAWESGWVPIPGGVQKTSRCGPLGYGLVGMVVLGWWLDLMILEVCSNLNDSMFLWFLRFKINKIKFLIRIIGFCVKYLMSFDFWLFSCWSPITSW